MSPGGFGENRAQPRCDRQPPCRPPTGSQQVQSAPQAFAVTSTLRTTRGNALGRPANVTSAAGIPRESPAPLGRPPARRRGARERGEGPRGRPCPQYPAAGGGRAGPPGSPQSRAQAISVGRGGAVVPGRGQVPSCGLFRHPRAGRAPRCGGGGAELGWRRRSRGTGAHGRGLLGACSLSFLRRGTRPARLGAESCGDVAAGRARLLAVTRDA